jgi:hypothetical protein
VSGPLFSDARLEATLPKPIASAQMAVMSFDFIYGNFGESIRPVEWILGLCVPQFLDLAGLGAPLP